MVMVSSQSFDNPSAGGNQQNPAVWYWNIIPKPVLATLEEELKDIPFGMPGDDGGPDIKPDPIRKYTQGKLPQFHWLEGVLVNYGAWANIQSQWGFNTAVPEAVELIRMGEGDYYNMHSEVNWLEPIPYSKKVTVLALLNDHESFEGGELKFDGIETQRLTRGTVVAFPAGLRWEITPVTKGSIWLAQTNVLGPRFM